MRSGKREKWILRLIRDGSSLKRSQADRPVARSDSKLLSSAAEAAPYGMGIFFSHRGGGDVEIVANGPVACVRVELRSELRRQVKRDASVARCDVPVFRHRGPR